MSSSGGVSLDLEAVHDSPDPADEEPAGEDLDETNDDTVLLLLVVLGEDTGYDGGPAWGKDGEDEDDETHLTIELDGVNTVVHGAHFVLLFFFKIIN